MRFQRFIKLRQARPLSHRKTAAMSKAVCFAVLCSTWILFNTVPTATADEKAEWFLRYHKESKKFELNEEVLPKLSALKEPIKVVSAVGDARVGKSTTLNFVHYIWENGKNGKKDIEEVFQTGDTRFNSVTQGIWISIFRQRDGNSIVLLDVEGVNLGNDAMTDHLSMFTALLSSGIGLFCSEAINNHILDFLYRLPRLGKHVFNDADVENGEKFSVNFGHLHVVIREALEPPRGQSLEDFVKDALITPSGDDEGIDNKRKVIAKCFRRQNITVSEMPLIKGRKLFRNTTQVKEHAVYWESIKTISQRFQMFPDKTSLRRVRIDGDALAQLAKTLVEAINKNSWMEFGDSYLMTEKIICDRKYKDIITPVLNVDSLDEFNERAFPATEEFRDQCPLREALDSVQADLRAYGEELHVREINRKKKLEEEERKKKESEWNLPNLLWMLTSGLAGYGVHAFSDARLKHNITTLSPSKYEALGLREVTWVWNENAQRLGLSGEARGVIAQEVEQLYPWAVLTGHDGYKRVNYAALDFMVSLVSNKYIAHMADVYNGFRFFPTDVTTAVGEAKAKLPLPRDGRDCSVVTQRVK